MIARDSRFYKMLADATAYHLGSGDVAYALAPGSDEDSLHKHPVPGDPGSSEPK